MCGGVGRVGWVGWVVVVEVELRREDERDGRDGGRGVCEETRWSKRSFRTASSLETSSRMCAGSVDSSFLGWESSASRSRSLSEERSLKRSSSASSSSWGFDLVCPVTSASKGSSSRSKTAS